MTGKKDNRQRTGVRRKKHHVRPTKIPVRATSKNVANILSPGRSKALREVPGNPYRWRLYTAACSPQSQYVLMDYEPDADPIWVVADACGRKIVGVVEQGKN